MTIKHLNAALLAAAAAAVLFAGCGKKEAAAPVSTAMPDRMPPVAQSELAVPGEVPDASAELAALVEPTAEPSQEPVAEPAPVSQEPAPTPEPTPEPTPTATPVPPPAFVSPAAPAETTEPASGAETLRPGTYEGADGSTLVVNADGTCTLETEVSGKINGKAMSAMLTFHGVVEEGAFSFDKVTYGTIDLTAIAAAAGYTDAAAWETTAALIYAAG